MPVFEEREVRLVGSTARGRHGDFNAKGALGSVDEEGRVRLAFVSQRRVNKKSDPQDEPFQPPNSAKLSPEDAYTYLRLLAELTRAAYVLRGGAHCRLTYGDGDAGADRTVIPAPEVFGLGGGQEETAPVEGGIVVDDPFGRMLEALAEGLLDYERLAGREGADAIWRAMQMRKAVAHVLALFGEDAALITPPLPEPAPPIRVLTPDGPREFGGGTRVRIVKITDEDDAATLEGLTGELTHGWQLIDSGLLAGITPVGGVWLDHGLGLTQERRVNLFEGDVVEVLKEDKDGGRDEDDDNRGGGNPVEALGEGLVSALGGEGEAGAPPADAGALGEGRPDADGAGV